ncbi:hypothetical protein E2C01_048912 [Portunus trituberculatus]|uniref:Uncharacterized protein n=1 Tax=Portunus trituberculatus TaxID=210409 RepID=A0A5B7G4W9_PORTR|nr:hypothetical protein [Portunus trituberculatus]
MGQRKGMRGCDIPSSSRDLFGTSLDIAGPLDMSMKGPPPRLGVNIHLQTPTKMDIYPVPQQGQQQHHHQHQQQHQDERTALCLKLPSRVIM